MSQDREKYLYFTVGLLKNSATMDALWQDALKYHMIDQPGKLIALRLTEYYDMLAQSNLLPQGSLLTQSNPQPGTTMPMRAVAKASSNGNAASRGSSVAASNGIEHIDDDGVVTASPNADQNADEAAEYWANM